MNILMVCLGNICRSPLAEGIMKTKVPAGFLIDSAGTISMHASIPIKELSKRLPFMELTFQSRDRDLLQPQILKSSIKSTAWTSM